MPEVLKTRSETRYCAVAWRPWGQSKSSLISVAGEIVLFDTLVIAQQWLPQLGGGRETNWEPGGEECYWLPIDPQAVNRAQIITQYDPYHLPAGMPAGILSETPGREWRHHIMWSHAFFDCGQLRKQADGSVVNLALGESPNDSFQPVSNVPTEALV